MTTGSIQLFDAMPGLVPLHQVAVHLHPDDNVAIAKQPLTTANSLDTHNGAAIPVRQFIPSGHKIAIKPIANGEPVYRYGQIIGFATQHIVPGDHVHLHNLGMGVFDRMHEIGVDAEPIQYLPKAERRTFLGYKRPDGRIGTRNYIAVISSVNCSGHTSKEIAHYFTPERLKDYPNVDGVIALTHALGCATRLDGAGYRLLQRTLAGMARHPNVAAYVMVGLGCETNQVDAILANYGLTSDHAASMTIQDKGGIRKTVQAGIEAVEALLPTANAAVRTPQPISELVVALQCGGSDSWSGVTANPLLGLVSDEIVRQGGTTVLGETTEVYGAEHLLTRRAVSPEVAQKLIDKIHWWEDYTRKLDMEIDNNPSAGNKVGGLTTIYEKSLGAVAKGGTMPFAGMFDYAEPINVRGFTMMDTPGYDPVSVTGQVAGGCNLVVFTTGRGSVFGFKPAPSIKLCTNTPTYTHLEDDMDFNAGRVLDGEDIHTLSGELLDMLIAVASGQPSKSEAQGVGENEFNPWYVGAIV